MEMMICNVVDANTTLKKSMRSKKFVPFSSTTFLSLYAVDEVLKN